jgi:hypothetical protein
MTRCVVVTVDIRDSELDEDRASLLESYERQLRYTIVVRPQVGESQPLLMERCAEAARDLAGKLEPGPSKPGR